MNTRVQLLVKKLSCYHHAGAKGEMRYSSYSFLTTTLDGMSGQRHVPAALYPRKRTPVPIEQEAEWASELVCTQRLEEKFFAPAWERIPVVQSIVRHYIDFQLVLEAGIPHLATDFGTTQSSIQ
jgi:hypothetical protein